MQVRARLLMAAEEQKSVLHELGSQALFTGKFVAPTEAAESLNSIIAANVVDVSCNLAHRECRIYRLKTKLCSYYVVWIFRKSSVLIQSFAEALLQEDPRPTIPSIHTNRQLL